MRGTLIRRGYEAVTPRPEMRPDSRTGRHDWQQSESIRAEKKSVPTFTSHRRNPLPFKIFCMEITTPYKE